MKDSRIADFHRMSVAQRIESLRERNWLDAKGARQLEEGAALIDTSRADRMIENVIGVFGLPLAVAPNFTVNGKDYVVPMVVEEASIVAGVSSIARLARSGGGFQAEANDPLLIGQLLLGGVADADKAIHVLEAEKEQLVALANRLQPNMQARGGGARSLELRKIALPGQEAVVLHLLVDTRDAMGANVVNTMCEGIAPRIEALTSGTAVLKILSNLAERSIVSANVTIPLQALSGRDPEKVRDAIVLATDFACADPQRAATHNKGIMNGIDAVAVATGNDWRSVEAGAHAWAARDGAYRSLSRWYSDAAGNLAGELVMPLRAGIVGGSLQSNPAVRIALQLANVSSAAELAQLMAAVGLAQNLAALRALVTVGIQKGHMRLHARSVAASAGAPPEHFERVVAGLIASGDVKVRRARELLAGITAGAKEDGNKVKAQVQASASGKVILLGEHAVVYDRHAVALPLKNAVTASVVERKGPSVLLFGTDEETVRMTLPHIRPQGLRGMLDLILRRLGMSGRPFEICLHSRIPQAAGLGSSAAVAVALTRAFDRAFRLGMTDEAVNGLAFDCERLAHDTPSGIDNAMATWGQPLLFRKSATPQGEILQLANVPPIVIACSGKQSLTSEMVHAVRGRRAAMRERYEALFDQIDEISVAGAKALVEEDYGQVGGLMNLCQGMLNAMGVSTPELERMADIARKNGAAGAKLTGAGGGGSIVALCPGAEEKVERALTRAGYRLVRLQG
ncbi:MAG: hydroxymethylglutaryl-CoA reductase, degradative [Woeseia sp.]